MAKSIGDVPNFPVRATQPNLSALPFQITFTSGTVSSSLLAPGMTFVAKQGTGIFRFKVPAAVATKFWIDADTTANTIVTFPNRDNLVPTGLIDIQTGTTVATTATDPADGTTIFGIIHEAWGR